MNTQSVPIPISSSFKNDPNLIAGLLFKYGLESFQSQNYLFSEKLFLQLLKIFPKNSDSLRFLGLIHFNSSNYLESSKFLFQSIALSKTSETYLDLGNTLFKLKKFEEALNCYDCAFSLNNASYESLYNKALVYIELNRLTDALSCLDLTLSINTNFSKAHAIKGNIYKDIEEFKNALSCYKAAISIDNSSYDVYFNQGIILEKLENFQEAIKKAHPTNDIS